MIKEIMTSEGKYVKMLPAGTRVKINKGIPYYDLNNKNLFGYSDGYDSGFTFQSVFILKDVLYAVIQSGARNILYSLTQGGESGYSYEPFGEDSYALAQVIVKYSDLTFMGGVKSAFIKLLHRFSLRGAVC
ncbi:hypothetical protein [uncultured Lactobacillus sp.]|uniref:hypothetical protein n=1 Tax=uncultured Lactobacillus sp. TaxID=153152 RepID=UPI00260F673E|nr:hypothetical protein [uncultured Lactobacillus sp.]